MFTKYFNAKKSPQSVAIPGSGQKPNSAGGFSWIADDWTRLQRFLILGSEGGSYYASEQKLTVENTEAVLRCIREDGAKTVDQIVSVSEAGRAPKNEPALFALALAASKGDDATRKLALASLSKVARTGTHLFHFAEYVEAFRGWGRGLREAVSGWYQHQSPDALVYQAIKYRQRDGWTHRDLLRLSHPKAEDAQRNAIYHWIVNGWPGVGVEPHPDETLRILWAFEKLQGVSSDTEAARLVEDFRLPMETIPSHLRGKEVWKAVLPHSGMTFLLRNLGNLGKQGLLDRSSGELLDFAVERLSNANALKKSKVHPIQILSALTTYKQGHGVRGKGEWKPEAKITYALNEAFHQSFANVEPTGKRWLLALDVSGSMSCGSIAGVPGLTPRVGSAAMAMLTNRTEENVKMLAFTSSKGYENRGVSPLNIPANADLTRVLKAVSDLPFGGTDCALPMIWALENRAKVDVFVIYTDSETWAGKIHPKQALDLYREKMRIPAKLVVVGMLSNAFTIADPEDAGMMDVVGFDTSTPEVIRQFIVGL